MDIENKTFFEQNIERGIKKGILSHEEFRKKYGKILDIYK